MGKRTGNKRGRSTSSRRPRVEHLEQRLQLTAVPTGDAALVHAFTAGPQYLAETPAAIAGSPSNRVIVFEGRGADDRHGVFVEVTNADATASLLSERVNDTAAGVQHSAQVAANATGRFVVVWGGRGSGDKSGVFFTLYNTDGSRVADASEIRVNETVGGEQAYPAVAMNSDGSFAVAWSGVGVGDESGVFLRRFNADGTADGDELLVNTTTDNHQMRPSLAYQTDGTLVVAWQSLGQDGSGWGVYSQRFTADGDPDGAETRLTTSTDGNQMRVHLAANPTGGIVVAWEDRGFTASEWDVVGRAYAPTGTADTPEVTLNSAASGVQRDATITVSNDGEWLAAWASGASDGAGWEAVVREFDASGVGDGPEAPVAGSGPNSGHQRPSSVAITNGDAWIAWSGDGPDDHAGVYTQQVDVGVENTDPQVAPLLDPIADRDASIGELLEIELNASDANAQDTLTFALDPSSAPAGMTLTQTSNNTATVSWTPDVADENQVLTVRVLVTDNGVLPLADAEEFTITVASGELTVDANGTGEAGNDSTSDFLAGDGPTPLAESLSVRLSDAGMVQSAEVRLTAAPDGAGELLAVDTLDTAINASYDPTTNVLSLTGEDTEANYQRVLRTLAYDNTASTPSGDRVVSITVTDAVETSAEAQITVRTVAPDLVGFAQALAAANAQFFGADWCPECTAQKELFEDGSQFLPFIEVTNPDRSLNTVGATNNISSFPTWVFDDGTRVEGVQTLEELSSLSGVAIPTSDHPFVAPLDDGDTLSGQRLIVGSPLHVSLDGYDPNGGVLTYEVTSDNPDVTAEILTGNRSARIVVEGYGDMVFELFEGRAGRATERMITLADQGFYDGIVFHRVVPNFVVQSGDPTGTGAGGSPLPDFNDQFHPDLQHNRSGILSMARPGEDDRNNSQYFVTDNGGSSARGLDFNHTVFGVLTEGEANRDGINRVATVGDQPIFTIRTDTVEIFQDTENAVVMLKAAEGATGSATITVTVTDEDGNSFTRETTFNLAADNENIVTLPGGRLRNGNGRPYLEDATPITAPQNTVATATLPAVDVENDPIFFSFDEADLPAGFAATINDSGELMVAPPTDFTGTIELTIGVGDLDAASNSARFAIAEDFERFTIEFT